MLSYIICGVSKEQRRRRRQQRHGGGPPRDTGQLTRGRGGRVSHSDWEGLLYNMGGFKGATTTTTTAGKDIAGVSQETRPGPSGHRGAEALAWPGPRAPASSWPVPTRWDSDSPLPAPGAGAASDSGRHSTRAWRRRLQPPPPRAGAVGPRQAANRPAGRFALEGRR